MIALLGRIWRWAGPTAHDAYHHLPLPIRKTANRLLLPQTAGIFAVQAGLCAGLRMEISPRQDSGFYFGTHEADLQAELAKQVRAGMTVFNVGAHVGFFGMGIATLCGEQGRVVCFEPDPSALSRLRRNLELNPFRTITVEPVAVGDSEGVVQFSFELGDMRSRFADLPYVPKDKPTTAVTCITLDGYFQRTGLTPQVVTIDAEHAEGRVLRGMRELMREARPTILVEMHGKEAIAEAFEELRRSGYALYEFGGRAIRKAAEIEPLGHYVGKPAA